MLMWVFFFWAEDDSIPHRKENTCIPFSVSVSQKHTRLLQDTDSSWKCWLLRSNDEIGLSVFHYIDFSTSPWFNFCLIRVSWKPKNPFASLQSSHITKPAISGSDCRAWNALPCLQESAGGSRGQLSKWSFQPPSLWGPETWLTCNNCDSLIKGKL